MDSLIWSGIVIGMPHITLPCSPRSACNHRIAISYSVALATRNSTNASLPTSSLCVPCQCYIFCHENKNNNNWSLQFRDWKLLCTDRPTTEDTMSGWMAYSQFRSRRRYAKLDKERWWPDNWSGRRCFGCWGYTYNDVKCRACSEE